MRLHNMALVRQWQFGLRVAHKAHIKAAARAEFMNKLLGIPTAIISAVVGTAVFASLAQTPGQTPGKWETITVGAASVLAAILSALQTHLRFSERAEQHRKAAGSYGVIRRELEQLLASYSDENPCEDAQIDAIGKTWAEVEAASPTLPQRLYTRIDREVRAAEENIARMGAAKSGGP